MELFILFGFKAISNQWVWAWALVLGFIRMVVG